MIIRLFFEKETSTLTYIVVSNGEAVIIDPVVSQTEQYMTRLKEMGVTLKYVLDTHVHADHITASGKLRELTGCETILGEHTANQCVSKKVKDGEQFSVGELTFTTIETPGHTNDSVCYYIPGYVFTGDTLLVRSTGRTDFQSGSVEESYNNIVKKLFTLPEETVIYPGHDYRGETASTIREEKLFNPRLAGKTYAEYAEIMNNLNLDRPKYMDVAVPANLQCGQKWK